MTDLEREMFLNVLRLRLMGWSYPDIDRLLFGLRDEPGKRVRGWSSWRLVKVHRHEIDAVLPSSAEVTAPQ